jgi:hypothetical protein
MQLRLFLFSLQFTNLSSDSSLPKVSAFLSCLFSLLSSLFFFFISQSTKLFFVFFFLCLCHNKSQISLLFSSQIAAPFSLNLLLTSFSFRLFPIFLSLPILSTQQISLLFRVSVNFIICNGVTV